MRRRRLFWQVFPAYVLLTVGLLLLLLLESRSRLRDFYLKQTASNMAASAAMFAQAATTPLQAGQYAEVETLAKQFDKASGLRITVILPDGRVVAESREDPAFMESHRTRPEIARSLDTGVMEYDVRRSDTLRHDFLYVALPLLRNAEPWLVVRVSMPATEVNEALGAFQRRIIYGALLAAVVIVAISWLIARRISRPLETMTRGAQRFGAGELDYRLPVGGSREIAALADTLNSMAVDLHDQIQTNSVQRKELEAVLFSMEEGVLTLDNQGKILNFNRAAGQMFQLDPAKARGRPIHEVLRKADVLDFAETVLSSALPLQKDIVIYDKDRHFLTAYGNLLRNTREERIGVLLVFRDVTQLRYLENVRRDFVANASHELRTPVTSIKGFVETLLDGGLEDRANAHRFLQIILDQANRLGAIINDILSLARVEKDSADQSVVLQCGPIREVLDAAVGMCDRQAQQKSIRLAVACNADLTADINPGLLEQAVTNLIDNAVKYSPPDASVEVTAAKENGGVVIHVIDHGCGIEPRHLSRLFERFYRADPGRSRQLGGTGLGLAIAKHIATAHGGSISVQSKPGEGSTFSIRLPEAKTQTEPAP